MNKTISFLGYASGIAAGDARCADGPLVLQKSPLLAELKQAGISADWQAMLAPQYAEALPAVTDLCEKLAHHTYELTKQKQPFTVMGGDHSCAIGTWSGVVAAVEGPIGLIWVDAHMDSHTPQTSDSGNIHGMPVACLLGYGEKQLTQILKQQPKLQPQYLSLIGIRSYEPGEEELIKRLGVRVYRMPEIQERGMDAIMQEAHARATTGTVGYGVSIDLDGIDPADAPGVGTPAPEGIKGSDLCRALQSTVQGDAKLIGAEIVEYNPFFDKDSRTQQTIQQLILAIFGARR